MFVNKEQAAVFRNLANASIFQTDQCQARVHLFKDKKSAQEASKKMVQPLLVFKRVTKDRGQ